MIKIENIETYGWEAAVRGMRNPKNSWKKSDSYPAVDCAKCGKIEREGLCRKEDRNCAGFECFAIGKDDMKLMQTLVNAGTDHGKFMRMIGISMDITAPLYWWKEFDTYKVGTVANSCSTMHKIADKEFTLEDFSHEHLVDEYWEKGCGGAWESDWLDALTTTIKYLNYARRRYLEAKVKPMKEESKRAENMKKYWWQMIQLLPSSYNQRRTVMMNYAVARNQYHARNAHKLDEWHDYCHVLEKLPYSELITMVRKQHEEV